MGEILGKQITTEMNFEMNMPNFCDYQYVCILVEIWDKNISYGLGSEAFLAPYLGSWQIHADFFLNSSDPAVKAV